MRDFKDLKVWRLSHELTLDVYRITKDFPRDEMFGITSQIRRSSLSIPANIAEGSGRKSDRELLRFLQIARGSASELEYHLILARDLGYMKNGEFGLLAARLVAIQRMLTSFAQAVRAKIVPKGADRGSTSPGSR